MQIKVLSGVAGKPRCWTVAERDQMEALAEDLNRELLALHG
jgi:hypothetical protein